MSREPNLRKLGRQYTPLRERLNPMPTVRRVGQTIMVGLQESLQAAPPPQFRMPGRIMTDAEAATHDFEASGQDWQRVGDDLRLAEQQLKQEIIGQQLGQKEK